MRLFLMFVSVACISLYWLEMAKDEKLLVKNSSLSHRHGISKVDVSKYVFQVLVKL